MSFNLLKLRKIVSHISVYVLGWTPRRQGNFRGWGSIDGRYVTGELRYLWSGRKWLKCSVASCYEKDAGAQSSLEGSLPRNRFTSKEKCCLGIPLLSAALVMTPSCWANFACR